MSSSRSDHPGDSDWVSARNRSPSPSPSPSPSDHLHKDHSEQDDEHLHFRNNHPRQDDERSNSHAEYGHIRNLLYTSHFLSTWNSRLFEFGAFLFLANVYPNTLLPASVYALARATSAAILSPMLGSYIDSVDRLSIVRLSIVGQRIAVAISCILLFLLLEFESLRESAPSSVTILTLLSLLACVEKLASILNLISVERDWVVIVADGDESRLGALNSQMRRIDLFCKLIGPLTIAFIDGASPRIAIITTGIMTTVSVLVEYFSIARVYNRVPALRAAKPQPFHPAQRLSIWARLQSSLSGTMLYVRHRAFLPSLALSFLHLTTLSFGGQFITWLLSLGVSSGMIGVLRGISAIFELSATWLGPLVMNRIGPTRSGIWFLNWEVLCVAIACGFFWIDHLNATLAIIGTVSAVICSRIGLWGFDLSAQLIIQEDVEPDLRGTFSSQEASLQNMFEMLAFASTVVFPKPEDFRYPATISASAVTVAGILFAAFVRLRRGHLVHFSNCVDRNGQDKGHTHWWKIKIPMPMGSRRHEDTTEQENEGLLETDMEFESRQTV